MALIDKNVDKRGTRAVAEAYLQFLYSKTAQDIEAKNHYRPRDPEVAARYASSFPKIKLYSVDRDLGGWHQLQKAHFADAGIFDQITAFAAGTPINVVNPDVLDHRRLLRAQPA